MVLPAQAAMMGAGAVAGYLGGKADKRMMERMKRDRLRQLKHMKRLWHTAYEKSAGEFQQARQDILGQGIAQMGQLTAGLGAGGLLNTTVAPNLARGVMSTTQQNLGRLGAQRAATEYDKWMDYVGLKGMTRWDNIQPQSQAEAYGQMGAGLGALGMMGAQGMGAEVDWTNLFSNM